MPGLLALRLLGLPDVPEDGAVDVLVPAGRRRVSTAYVRVHPTVRPPRCWTHAWGVRVADPHRAVVDAARRSGSLQEVRALVLGALCQRWCGLDQLRAELDAGPRNGTALCRRVLRDGERGAWSAPEAEVADVAVADGRLPALLLNPTLLVGGVLLGQPDGWFVGLGLGWEVDSRRFHVTPRRARQLGAAYADVLASAVAARRLATQPEPRGLVVRPFDPRARAVRDLCGPLPAWPPAPSRNRPPGAGGRGRLSRPGGWRCGGGR